MEYRRHVALWCALIAAVGAINANAADTTVTDLNGGATHASVGRQAMVKIDMEWIENCAQRFLDKAYGRKEIEAEFGAVESDTNPNLLQLVPKDARLARVELVIRSSSGTASRATCRACTRRNR
jgi:hypothetical protein